MNMRSSSTASDDAHIPGADGHFCEVHQEEAALVQAVVRFLAAGAANGESIVLVTRKKRQQLILDWLRAKLPAAARLEADGRLFLQPSQALLEHVGIDGEPAWEHFESQVRDVLAEASANGQCVRVYGDAVSELWQAGRHSAAVTLEAWWNRTLSSYPDTRVFCGYLIDLFDPQSCSRELRGLGLEHSVMMPGNDLSNVLRCVDQASRELLGVSASMQALREVHEDDWRTRIPLPMRTVLWLLENEEDAAAEVLERARELYAINRNGTQR